jgi:hypothetical protein
MMLRFAVRHVFQTVYDFTVDNMVALGWTDAGSPFDAMPTRYQQFPIVGSKDDTRLEPNMVAISIGMEEAPVDAEMGGSMRYQNVPLFAEVYGENTAVALSIASDLRDIWQGRRGGLVLPVLDYTNDPPTEVPGWFLELGDTARGEVEARYFYQVVRSSAVLTYNDEVY